jgi:hypothetical protein
MSLLSLLATSKLTSIISFSYISAITVSITIVSIMTFSIPIKNYNQNSNTQYLVLVCLV